MKKLLCVILFFCVGEVLYAQDVKALKKEKKELKTKLDSLKVREKLSKEINELKRRIKYKENDSTYTLFPKVRFDFDSRSYITIPKKIKRGEFYQIQIENINLNQYWLEIESSDTVYSSALSFPTFGTLDLSTLSGLVSALSVESTYQEKIDENSQKAIQLFKTDIKKPKNNRQLIELTVALIKTEVVKFANELKSLENEIEEKKFNYMTYRILRQSGENADLDKPDVASDLKDFEKYRDVLKGLKKK